MSARANCVPRAAPSPADRAAGGGGAAAGPRVELTVRRAAPSDEAPLSFFFDTVLRRDYFVRRGQLGELLRSAYHQVWVAEIDCILVGVAITTRSTRLVNAIVHPAYRGLGIGQALVNASGASEVRAKLDMSSGDPRGFYERLGFKATGETNEKGNIELMRRAAERNGGTSRACGEPRRARRPK
ncbi:MAG: GNAT family N-acetyltransferase [Phycisphaerales bacterium]|nr:GNAT family N-acetyltransferase [Phycisphaerales bacterium]